GAHDPSIIEEGSTWWVFSTGAGLPVKHSADGLNWVQGAPLFASELPWWRTYAPTMGLLDVWGPDVLHEHRPGGLARRRPGDQLGKRGQRVQCPRPGPGD